MWKMLPSAILPIMFVLAATCGTQSQTVGATDQATFIVA